MVDRIGSVDELVGVAVVVVGSDLVVAVLVEFLRQLVCVLVEDVLLHVLRPRKLLLAHFAQVDLVFLLLVDLLLRVLLLHLHQRRVVLRVLQDLWTLLQPLLSVLQVLFLEILDLV